MPKNQVILIVDDDHDLRNIMAASLKHAEYNVVTADNGHSAIKQFQKHYPSLVFMDVTMPKMDGYEAFFEIKRQFENARIIMISGNPKDKRLQKAMNFGLLDYLEKPVSTELLKKMIEQHADKNLQIPNKKDVVAYAIESVLLEMGPLELSKVRNRLQDEYNCDLRDCLEDPLCLKLVLCELFGQNYDDILLSIEEILRSHESKEITQFIQVMNS